MTFRRVRIKNIDNRSPYIYPSRTIEIKMDQTVTTPSRGATLTEYNYKGKIPTEIPLDNTVSMSMTRLNLEKLDSLLHQNGVYARYLKKLWNANDLMKYSPFTIHMLQPTITRIKRESSDGTEIEIMSGTEYLVSNQSKMEQFLRFIIKMQIDLKLEIISIPYLHLPFDKYSKLIKDVVQIVRNAGSEPLFVFDLGYGGRKEKFAEALKFVIDIAGVKLLGFPYKSYANSSVSYDVLASHVEDDVVFLSLEVPREEFMYSLSTMHYLPFLGNDIFAVETPRYGYGSKSGDPNAQKKKIQIISKEKIKFFNSDNLLIEPSSARLKSPNQVLSEINEGGNQKLLEIVNEYPSIGTEQDKLSVIKFVSRIHELKSSSIEFQRVNRFINSNESSDYIKDKPYLQTSLATLKSTKKGT